ncbi:MAG: BrnA antitoxin family protein [Candidatus Rokuibacteriota bacterium]
MARASVSSARAERATKSVPPTRRRRGIDFSDIPETSPVQLRAMRRVGRPPFGAAARRLIAIRIDPQVLAAVRREAKRRGLGYQSLINNLLAKHVARVRSA